MKDIQNQIPKEKILIDKVGIKDLRYPITVKDKIRGSQTTVASINMYVNLPHNFRGTHMSRFIEVLGKFTNGLDRESFDNILIELKKKLDATDSHLEIEFPYFIEKQAPVSKAASLMEYTCEFIGSYKEKIEFTLGVKVPITTLCPCSQAISKEGAHNQRGYVKVRCKYTQMIWIEDLVAEIEQCGSAPLYSLLKREDEKFVTEQAYNNPKFVEDIVRGVAKKLQKNKSITWFSIEAENMESIHNHNAYAMLEWTRE